MKTELTWSEMEQRRRMKDLYTGFFVITILIWVLRFLLSLVSGLLPDYGFYGTSVLSIFSEAVSVLIPFCLYRKFARDPFRDLFREKVRSEHPVLRTLIGIFASVGLSVAGFCGCYCLISFCELHGVHTAVSLPSVGQTVPEFLFYLILSSVVFGFVYEFSFRGIA